MAIAPLPPAISEKDKRRTFKEAALFVYGLLVFSLWILALFGNRGFAGHYALGLSYQKATAELHQARQENEDLRLSVKALRDDDTAIERIAREELRMVKPGEKVYLFFPQPVK